MTAEPISLEELRQAQARLTRGSELPDPRTMGQHLADWLVMTGDWRNYFRYRAWVADVTVEQVHILARTTLTAANRTVVTPDDSGATLASEKD